MTMEACHPTPHSDAPFSGEYDGNGEAGRPPRSPGAPIAVGSEYPPRLTSAGPKTTDESCPATEPRSGAASCGDCTCASEKTLCARAGNAKRKTARKANQALT